MPVAGISLSGGDWLGIGSAISGVSTARTHEACGQAPMFFASKERKAQYQECIDNYVATIGANVQTQKEIAEKRLKQRQKIIIATVGIAVVGTIIIVAIRKTRSNGKK